MSLSALDILLGLCTEIYPPAGLSLISDLFSSKERGKYIGVHEAAVPAGMTLGPVFVGLMLDLRLNWNGIFQLCILSSAIVLVSQLLLFRIKDGRPSPYV
ncbi:MAG: MFS transporter [Nitrososphaeria archaeon]